MRKFVNAFNGYNEKERREWERARLIAWYSAYDRKPFDITKIHIPGETHNGRKVGVSQENKDSIYKTLEKWNK